MTAKQDSEAVASLKKWLLTSLIATVGVGVSLVVQLHIHLVEQDARMLAIGERQRLVLERLERVERLFQNGKKAP